MSVRLKKAAKKLRRLFGVAGGVRPAKNGETCKTPTRREPGSAVLEDCGERAHVIEGDTPLCYHCMKSAHKRKHDQKLPQQEHLHQIKEPAKYDGAVDERMSGLWKRSRQLAGEARLLERARKE